jgi:multiple sugar transport system substrate-binding protein
MNRVTGAVLAYLLAGCVVMTACAPQAAPPSNTPTAVTGSTPAGGLDGATGSGQNLTTAPAGSLKGEISLQAFGEPAEIKVIEDLVAGFKEVHPDVKINIIAVPSQGDHMSKLSAAFAAGNPPELWLLNYRRYGQFAARDVIEPAGVLLQKSQVLKEDMFYPQPLEAFRYKGVLQCIPQNISSLVVYYNKDLFTQYNVPFPTRDWTWDDFLNTAKALTKDTNGDGTNDIHGLGVPPQIIRVAPFVWQNGGEIVDDPDKPTQFTLMEGPAREAVDFFMNLQLVHKVVPTEAEEKAEDMESRFMNGRLAMFMASRVATPQFRQIKGFEWDVAWLPRNKQRASILHSDAYCISKQVSQEKKDIAWAFVEYSQGPVGQARVARLGRTVPSLKQVAESPVFLEPTEPPANSRVFLDAIPEMRLVPILSTWPRIENMANAELEEAFYGNIAVDEALAKLTELSKPLFAEGLADK